MRPVETHNTTHSEAVPRMKAQERPRHKYETFTFKDGVCLAFETDDDFEALPKFRERLKGVTEWRSVIFEHVDSSKLDVLRDLGEFLTSRSSIYQIWITFDTATDLSFLEEWACSYLKLVFPLGTEVDLSPISSVGGLKELTLYGIHEDSLDLSLLDINGLVELTLCCIDTDTLDLSLLDNSDIVRLSILGERIDDKHYGVQHLILPQSKTIRRIGIDGNKITDIDLTPLSYCTALEYVGISHEPLTELDLSPLSHCKKLKDFGVGKNLIEDLDLTPLLSCPELKRFSFVHDRPILTIQQSQLDDTSPKIIKKFIERKHILPI